MSNRELQLLWFAWLFVAVASCQGAANEATAKGLVVDESGKALPNAVVLFTKVPLFVPGPTPFQSGRSPLDVGHAANAVSNTEGTFSVQGLYSDRYSVCVRFPDLSHLNTCSWDGDYVVDMRSPSGDQQLKLVARTASVVRISLADPLGLLGTASSMFGIQVVVGVKTQRNAYYSAELQSISNGVRSYLIAVPLNEPLRLWLFSRNFGIVDASGKVLDHLGVEIPFQADRQSLQTFSFRVTSLN